MSIEACGKFLEASLINIEVFRLGKTQEAVRAFHVNFGADQKCLQARNVYTAEPTQ